MTEKVGRDGRMKGKIGDGQDNREGRRWKNEKEDMRWKDDRKDR